MHYELRQTAEFQKWLRKSKWDVRKQVLSRLTKVENGNFGDHRHLGGGVSELRFKRGAGLRLYYTKQAQTIILLLSGGTKSTQGADIEKARDLVQQM